MTGKPLILCADDSPGVLEGWKLLTLLCLSRSAYPGFWKSWTTWLVYVFCFSRSVTWKKRTAAKRP
jgi:hypothetical protein